MMRCVILIGCVLIAACAPLRTRTYVEAVGTARTDPALTNPTQRRATCRIAAVATARRKLLDSIGAPEEARLAGVEVVRTEWPDEENCRVTIRVRKDRLRRTAP